MAKTKVTQKEMFERRNTSDIFNRLVIMGLLRILNMNLKYTQIWSDDEDGIQEVTVPFFFDFSGGSQSSERFIQDNYLQFTDDECTSIGIKKFAGNYNIVPLGVITFEGSSIDSGNMSNRFVMGQFQKRIGKEYKSYVAFLYSIPLTMNFNVNIGCDTINTAWKIEQAYREFFYKNKTFHINYKGTIVPVRVGFPESISSQKNTTYSFGQSQTDGNPDIKLSFSLQAETYQPVFDPYTERPADNTIKSFASGIHMQEKTNDMAVNYKGEENGKIYPVQLADKVIMSEQDVLLQWNWDYNRSDLLMVDIMYESETEGLTLIETVDNYSCYHLQLPDDFVENPVILDVIIPNNENTIVVNSPKLKFWCDPETDIVSSATCAIIDKGFIITDRESIDAIVSYENTKGKIIEVPIKINIKSNAVDDENPVTMKDFRYGKEYGFKKIKLFIRDHLDQTIIGSLQNDDEWITVF